MRTAILSFSLLGLLAVSASSLPAKTPLGEALKDIDVAEHWIYDDLPKAVDEAKSSGKPLLVVLRCVPCPPGRTLDAKVMQPDAELAQLERQFVCVRLIQTNSLDLNVFQFDMDMSWAAMFLNADGTVYGRYGSRDARGPQSDAYLSAVGFQNALERALKLHESYPGNKEQLAGKRGKAPDYPVPVEIPGLEKFPDSATTKQNCIHCHMVRQYEVRAKWKAGRLATDDVFVFPMPGRIGLTMEVDDGLLVKRVSEDSPAAAGGVSAGDELVSINGQPLVSTADIQWALHTLPETPQLPVELRRDGKLVRTTLPLGGKWRHVELGWRASTWYGLRQGMRVEPFSSAEKRTRGIEEDGLALVVKEMAFWSGEGFERLRRAGVRVGDVILAVDGNTEPMTESEFLAYVRLTHGPRDAVKFTILRGDQREELTIPMW
jgi:hypothetical protein